MGSKAKRSPKSDKIDHKELISKMRKNFRRPTKIIPNKKKLYNRQKAKKIDD